jgi:hypothetical protein
MRKLLVIRVLIHVKGMWIFTFYKHTQNILVDRDNSVGLATRYGLDGPGIEPGMGEFFRTRPDRPCDPPNKYQVFPWCKAWRCSPTHNYESRWSRESRCVSVLSVWAFVACFTANITRNVYNVIYFSYRDIL